MLHLYKEIEKDDFVVKQKLVHYSIGEGLNIYNLVATAAKPNSDKYEIVKNIYGICLDEELHDIYWFGNFETRAKEVYIMKKSFQKAFSKLHCSFPEFEKVFKEHIISPERMFLTLAANNGEIEDYILVKYNEEHEKCRFFKQNATYKERWMPHLEPFNHKTKMVTSKEYDIEPLYDFLQKHRSTVVMNGIEETHDIFDDEIIKTINFYVLVENADDAHRDIMDDLPAHVIDISRFKYPPLKARGYNIPRKHKK